MEKAWGGAEIQVMQHAVGLIDAETKALEKRDVANQNAKTDRQKQQGFVLLGNGKVDKGRSHKKHDDIAKIDQIVTGVG